MAERIRTAIDELRGALRERRLGQEHAELGDVRDLELQFSAEGSDELTTGGGKANGGQDAAGEEESRK